MGGSPILIETDADDLTAHFVIATTDFDSDPTQPTPQVKRESDQGAREPERGASGIMGRPGASGRQVVSGGVGSGRSGRSETGGRASRSASAATTGAGDKGKGKAPLFNPPSQEEEEEDEFGDGGMDDFDEGAFAEIDRMSQMPPTGPGGGSQRADTLVPDTADGDEERAASELREMSLGLGPTQRGVAGTEERMNGEAREVKKVSFPLKLVEARADRSSPSLTFPGKVESARRLKSFAGRGRRGHC